MVAMPDMTVLTENALGVTLARVVDTLDEGRWVAQDTIGYERTGGGKEIDLAALPVPISGRSEFTVPIEVKWIDQGWRGEARVLEGRHGRGVIATKSILDLDNPTWAIPVPLVALLLG
jgi:uncharacterized protein